MKLPIAGQPPKREVGQAERVAPRTVERSLLLVMAGPTSPWPLLQDIAIPIFRLGVGVEFHREIRKAPQPHEVLLGPPYELIDALPKGPRVLLGDWAAGWLVPSCLVVCSALPRHAWPSELRHLEPALILRDARPAVVEALCHQL